MNKQYFYIYENDGYGGRGRPMVEEATSREEAIKLAEERFVEDFVDEAHYNCRGYVNFSRDYILSIFDGDAENPWFEQFMTIEYDDCFEAFTVMGEVLSKYRVTTRQAIIAAAFPDAIITKEGRTTVYNLVRQRGFADTAIVTAVLLAGIAAMLITWGIS